MRHEYLDYRELKYDITAETDHYVEVEFTKTHLSIFELERMLRKGLSCVGHVSGYIYIFRKEEDYDSTCN